MQYRTLISFIVCTSIFAMKAGIARADLPASTPEKIEPPKIQSMLAAAKNLEDNLGNQDAAWQLAVSYCEASRLGSIEAQYRLGMLYRFGKGVPENQTYAASLFSQAASQGHTEALNMLDTIKIASSELPPCVTGYNSPERAVVTEPEIAASHNEIERRIAALPDTKRWIIDLVETIAAKHQIDPKLVLAVIAVESNFDAKARSPKDAMGLMQLIPDTADRFNIANAYDAAQNIKGGIRYLRWLLSYYRGDVALAAAAYNAGEGAVDRYKGVPPYPETRNYVKRIINLYRQSSHPYDEGLTKPSPINMRSG